MAAFVLGNGVSRQAIDPALLQQLGPVYGCNALYRTHTPTVLVATDAPIAAAIQASGYAQGRRFYTRRPQPDSGALPVPQQYFGFSSGPIAMALAAMDRQDPVYLLGFDLGPDSLGRFNNVYAGTEFYKPVGDRPTFSGNWVRQMVKIAADFPHQQFVRVQGATSAAILDFDRSPNIRSMAMQEFLLAINKVEET
jgi:hypothetical protein